MSIARLGGLMSGFQPKAEGFDSPAAHHKRGDPLYCNVYVSDGKAVVGRPHRTRRESKIAVLNRITLAYRIAVYLREKAMT